MTIKIGRGVRAKIEAHPGGIVLQVRGTDETSAAAGLARARDELWRRLSEGGDAHGGSGASFIEVIQGSPEGPAIFIDASDVPVEGLREIPEIVSQCLAEEGVDNAEIDFPTRNPLEHLHEVPGPVVVLRMYPWHWEARGGGRPLPSIPPGWFRAAADWLGAPPGSLLDGRVNVLPVALPSGAWEPLARKTVSAGGSVTFVSGELTGSLRGVSSWGGILANMSLVAGGRATTPDELLGSAHQLISVARNLADSCGYAFLTFDDTFKDLVFSTYESEWVRYEDGVPSEWINKLLHVIVLDAFPYQVLNPGHLDRLRARPDGEGLKGDRWGVSLGDLREWLDPDDRASLRRRARGVLRPLLWKRSEAEAYLMSSDGPPERGP